MRTTLSVSEIAAVKNCTRYTIYRNKKSFTWVKVKGNKVKKILWDKKAENWQKGKPKKKRS